MWAWVLLSNSMAMAFVLGRSCFSATKRSLKYIARMEHDVAEDTSREGANEVEVAALRCE